VAAGCFFNYYVLPNPAKGRSKLYNSLPEIYANAPGNSALCACIVALGIASMSSSMKIPSLMMKANAKYAEALNLINSALRDPLEAKRDDTLMVVILLGLYEEVTRLLQTRHLRA
jgi:Fungal specific transcription factor domain